MFIIKIFDNCQMKCNSTKPFLILFSLWGVERINLTPGKTKLFLIGWHCTVVNLPTSLQTSLDWNEFYLWQIDPNIFYQKLKAFPDSSNDKTRRHNLSLETVSAWFFVDFLALPYHHIWKIDVSEQKR